MRHVPCDVDASSAKAVSVVSLVSGFPVHTASVSPDWTARTPFVSQKTRVFLSFFEQDCAERHPLFKMTLGLEGEVA